MELCWAVRQEQVEETLQVGTSQDNVSGIQKSRLVSGADKITTCCYNIFNTNTMDSWPQFFHIQ